MTKDGIYASLGTAANVDFQVQEAGSVLVPRPVNDISTIANFPDLRRHYAIRYHFSAARAFGKPAQSLDHATGQRQGPA